MNQECIDAIRLLIKTSQEKEETAGMDAGKAYMILECLQSGLLELIEKYERQV